MQSSRYNRFRVDRRAGDIMNRFSISGKPGLGRANSMGATFSKNGNCRKSLTSARGRSDALARRLDGEWRELRRHGTIEIDLDKMLRLTNERDQRRVPAEAGNDRNDR
jgi:hypothetical protein